MGAGCQRKKGAGPDRQRWDKGRKGWRAGLGDWAAVAGPTVRSGQRAGAEAEGKRRSQAFGPKQREGEVFFSSFFIYFLISFLLFQSRFPNHFKIIFEIFLSFRQITHVNKN